MRKLIYITIILLSTIYIHNIYAENKNEVPIDSKNKKAENKKLIDCDPDKPENKYTKAFMLENDDFEVKDAINIYKDILKKTKKNDPLRAKTLLRLGIAYYKIDDYKNAKKYLQTLKADFPNKKKLIKKADFYLDKIEEKENQKKRKR